MNLRDDSELDSNGIVAPTFDCRVIFIMIKKVICQVRLSNTWAIAYQ
jgi:hypothetical protein